MILKSEGSIDMCFGLLEVPLVSGRNDERNTNGWFIRGLDLDLLYWDGLRSKYS